MKFCRLLFWTTMATFFQQKASSSLHQRYLALKQPVQQTAGSSGTTAASLAFQTCCACKRSFFAPPLSSLSPFNSRRLRTRIGMPMLEGQRARRQEHCRTGSAIRALQNEGEALEKVRSQLEEQLSKSNPTAVQEAGKAGESRSIVEGGVESQTWN